MGGFDFPGKQRPHVHIAKRGISRIRLDGASFSQRKWRGGVRVVREHGGVREQPLRDAVMRNVGRSRKPTCRGSLPPRSGRPRLRRAPWRWRPAFLWSRSAFPSRFERGRPGGCRLRRPTRPASGRDGFGIRRWGFHRPGDDPATWAGKDSPPSAPARIIKLLIAQERLGVPVRETLILTPRDERRTQAGRGRQK